MTAVVITVAVITVPAHAQTTVIELRPTDTGWSTSRQPTATHPSSRYLSASRTSDSSYLKFDGSVLDGQQIESATLRLHVASTTATAGGVQVRRAGTGWSGSKITDRNKPDTGSGLVNSDAPRARKGQDLSVSLRRAAVDTGTFALQLRYSQPYVSTTFSRSGDNGPVLRVTVKGSVPTAPVTNRAKVFAHYFPPYPLSIDNRPAADDYYARNYLDPNGENGKHAAYGGLLRDRPLPVKPGDADWKLRNLRTEVDQAKAGGIDGFLLNLMTAEGRNWDAGVNLMQAATDQRGFVVAPMVDGTSSFADLAPSAAADKLSTLYHYRSAYRTPRGFVLSSFAAEKVPVSWWRSVISTLEQKYRIPITFQAVFLNADEATMKAYAPVADGFGNWGTRTVDSVRNAPDYAQRAHRLGKSWMAPIAVQDVRPRSGAYAESSNTATLRAMWADAIADGADSVQLVTWNDYSESTQFAPSVAHGRCFLDASSYYSRWFRSGSRPAVGQDELIVSHRIQSAAARPTHQRQTMRSDLGGASTAQRNKVEVLTFLTAPATVTVTVGGHRTTFRAPAGSHATVVRLHTGKVSATLQRDGADLTVKSPHPVVSRPKVQDLQYYASCAKS